LKNSNTDPKEKRRPIKNHSGQLMLPLALLLGLMATAAIGLLSLQESWRRRVQAQLQLDRCAAELALSLRKIQRSLETTNTAIQVARASKVAASAAGQGQIVATADASIKLLIATQQLQLAQWMALQIGKGSRAGCLTAPRPLAWIRPSPDPVGPRPLEWPSHEPRRIELKFRRGFLKGVLKSHAVVFDEQRNGNPSGKWTASYDLWQARGSGPGPF
jgi:hypothetical protein